MVKREVTLLSARDPHRLRAMNVSAFIKLISPARCLSWRSLWQHHKVCKRHDQEEQQHGDVAVHVASDGAEHGSSQLPCSTAFEFEGERRGVGML